MGYTVTTTGLQATRKEVISNTSAQIPLGCTSQHVAISSSQDMTIPWMESESSIWTHFQNGLTALA